MSGVGFSWSSKGRIPALDGLRAVAIGLVLTAHAMGTGALPMNARLSTLAADLGVRSFFVLSGFLITTLLLRERASHGRVSLPRFYWRRVFRIFPAFYAYLGVVGLLAFIGILHLRDNDMVAAATYTMNFHGERAWSVGHLWSLAVEEQFYIIWPLALVALGLLRAWWFAFGAVLLAPVLRVVIWELFPAERDFADQALPCVFDALATGCLMAFAMPRLSASRRCGAVLSSRWFLLVPVVGLLALATRTPWLRYGVGMSVGNLAIAAVILRCVAFPKRGVVRYLEATPLVWIGTLSYSLYLWQQIFVNRHAGHWINVFPLNIAAAFAAAIVCHYVIERPCLRINERLRPAPQPRRAPEISVLIPTPVLDLSSRSPTPRPSTIEPVERKEHSSVGPTKQI